MIRKPSPESQIHYESYLQLEKVLNAQEPVGDPSRHDEMLFIIQHQVAELWFKLALHELDAAIDCLQKDEIARSIKVVKRLKQVQYQLISQWSVLATLTPSEYTGFRDAARHVVGHPVAAVPRARVQVRQQGQDHAADVPAQARNTTEGSRTRSTVRASTTSSSGICIESGHRVFRTNASSATGPNRTSMHPGVVDVLKIIYERPDEYWAAYELCENLVDVETNFQAWRFHHIKTVERIIGFKTGTGGTSGVPFLKKTLDTAFFPELAAVRTKIGD